jgi:hypothetical protein
VKASASAGATGRHPAGVDGMRPPRGAERLSAVGTARPRAGEGGRGGAEWAGRLRSVGRMGGAPR